MLPRSLRTCKACGEYGAILRAIEEGEIAVRRARADIAEKRSAFFEKEAFFCGDKKKSDEQALAEYSQARRDLDARDALAFATQGLTETCVHCHLPYDPNGASRKVCCVVQPNGQDCSSSGPHSQTCGCNIIMCQVCDELVCPSCKTLHDEMDEVRCGAWAAAGSHVKFACLRLAQNAFYPEGQGDFDDLRFHYPEHGTWFTIPNTDGLTFCKACRAKWRELKGRTSGPDVCKYVEKAKTKRAEINAMSDFKTQQLLCYGNVA